jgi:hypothetical protein
MKKLLAALLLLASCTKDSSLQDSGYQTSRSTVTSLTSSVLVAKGSLDLQINDAGIASLGVVNYRSLYQLCGTSGEGLVTPIDLPLSDSSTFSTSILRDGDSLSVELYLDPYVVKNYNLSVVVQENGVTVINDSLTNSLWLSGKFVFHNGSSYTILGNVQ